MNQKHSVSLIFGITLVVLVGILFSTFAIGAYLFYDSPISSVVAITHDAQRASPYISIVATSLNSSSTALIWVDPNVNYDNNGYPSSIDQSSGFRITSALTDSQGNLAGNFSVSQSVLTQIMNDGQQVHSLWIIEPSQTATANSQFMSVSPLSEQNFSTSTQRNGITFFATLYTFVLPVNFDLGSLFMVLWTIYLILFAMALNGPVKNVFRALQEATRSGISGLFDNSILATVAVFPLVLWSSVLLALLQQSVGVQTGSLPSTDPLLLLAELSIAPIREELGFRVIPIGLGALLILVFRGRIRDGLLSLWHPSKYLKKNLDPATYKKRLHVIYILIGVSAFLFGIAHYLLGAGWGPGKIAEAAIAGVALAALYYKYGLPAAILLHWAIDYSLTTYEFSPSLAVPYDFIILYTLAIAAATSIAFIMILFWSHGRKSDAPFNNSG
ncbi:MAG: CPBP family glutamic-type intramembrane protease [Nitrososphaerales archaeon]